ncbi:MULTISPECIES: iron-siderophore ABC transporter substrate-binding protein [unclassified Crossiella]|uniref:ABC transporter substrate-binding protein n=1 Tax=unclassified Crossiella TaxID=2620835 RepID=UPI001FFF19E7|nr:MULTISPECIES: iron-siderophore ABC transporter substrate-binding protein [unclassified Crossiella]MCK2244893.1 iron-siderophore ABC transporter substrate-binding protein [Crossiella sp. S99.2]MCK2258554.1 iron-siderophore ABC transporter substrate-binding protein [Crossiella sp. S99.1]
MTNGTRRLAAGVMGGLLVLLAGCGGAKPADVPAVAVGGADFGKAGEQSAQFGTTAAPGMFPRVIKHGMGETTLPKRPERVIVLDTGELDNVVSLGLKPVGVAFTEGSPEMPAYLRDKAGTPENVGSANALKLEAIKKLAPDLILGSKLRAEAQYKVLSAIAPTVFSLRPGYTWKENFRLNAAALDRSADADKMIKDFEAHALVTGNKIEAKQGKRPTVSMVRFMPGKIRLYADKSLIGTVLKDARLPRPEPQKVDDLAVEVSAENLAKADGDVIFIGTYGDPAKTAQKDVQGSPLWQQLSAVKAGRSHPVNDETWYLGLGVLSAESILGDLERLLA